MKRTIIIVSILFAIGLSVGCNKRRDYVAGGIRVFGERKLKDGTTTTERVEHRDGTKELNVTLLADGTKKADRVERPDGQKLFDVTYLPDGTTRMRRTEQPNGEKWFDVTKSPDREVHIVRIEFPDGSVRSDVTRLPDGTEKPASQDSSSNDSGVSTVEDSTAFTFEVSRTEIGVNHRVPGMPMYDQTLYVAHGEMNIHGKTFETTVACTVGIKTCRRLTEEGKYTWDTLPPSDPRVYKASMKGHVNPMDSILISNGRAKTVYYFVKATDQF